MLRYRGSKSALTQVKELDAFPKIPEAYVQTSTQGGAISICTFMLILVLVISEIKYYFESSLKYTYQVDHDFNEQVWLNFDITIATKCPLIGADVLDVTGQASVFEQEIKEDPCLFALSPDEERMRSALATEKYKLLDNDDGNKLSELAIKKGFNATAFFFGKSVVIEKSKSDSCRFYGNIKVKKVSGNFHITSGKPISIAGSHAHISFMAMNSVFNFSHRINHFSFGDMKTGFINPLDGDEVISNTEGIIYNYYINVVSTKIRSSRVTTDSFQYSVTEQTRGLDHNSGSHGMPGIFFKYDFSPLAVTINEAGMPFSRFLVRLCGIIGGIFATSTILNGLVSIILAYFKNNLKNEATNSDGDNNELTATLLPTT